LQPPDAKIGLKEKIVRNPSKSLILANLNVKIISNLTVPFAPSCAYPAEFLMLRAFLREYRDISLAG